jgi:hypothetical protein
VWEEKVEGGARFAWPRRRASGKVHPTAALGGKAKCEVTATPAGLQEPHRRSRVKVDGGYSADRWAFVDDGDGYVLKLISKWAWSK